MLPWRSDNAIKNRWNSHLLPKMRIQAQPFECHTAPSGYSTRKKQKGKGAATDGFYHAGNIQPVVPIVARAAHAYAALSPSSSPLHFAVASTNMEYIMPTHAAGMPSQAKSHSNHSDILASIEIASTAVKDAQPLGTSKRRQAGAGDKLQCNDALWAERKKLRRIESNLYIATLDRLLPNRARSKVFKGAGARSPGIQGRSICNVLTDCIQHLKNIHLEAASALVKRHESERSGERPSSEVEEFAAPSAEPKLKKAKLAKKTVNPTPGAPQSLIHTINKHLATHLSSDIACTSSSSSSYALASLQNLCASEFESMIDTSETSSSSSSNSVSDFSCDSASTVEAFEEGGGRGGGLGGDNGGEIEKNGILGGMKCRYTMKYET